MSRLTQEEREFERRYPDHEWGTDCKCLMCKPCEVQPLHDRIVVERLPDEDQERSGLIYIPEVVRKQSMKARVLAVGPGAWRDGEFVKTAVKPGDIVVLPGYGGQHPDWEGKQQLIIQEGDIGAVIG